MNNEDTDQVSSNVTCVNIYMYIFICTKFFGVSKNECGNKKNKCHKEYIIWSLQFLLPNSGKPYSSHLRVLQTQKSTKRQSFTIFAFW